MNKKNLNFILLALLIAILFIEIRERYREFVNTHPTETNIPQIERVIPAPTQTESPNKNFVEVPIAPMKEFSGLTAEEILKLRKQAVSESPVFYNKRKYEPNLDVFRIEDGLQWISAHEISCYGVENSKEIGKGESRESTGILNPELMLYIVVGNLNASEYSYCSDIDYLRPYKISYNADTKTIQAYINYKDYKNKNNGFRNIVLADANARDMGYNYLNAELSRNIRYRYDSNLSNKIIQTSGFYHRGYACGKPEGCNNYSPYETGYEFYLTDLPAQINIKLWEKKPLVNTLPADLNYQLIFN